MIAGLAAHLIMWLIIRTLSHYDSADLFGIHYAIFGKWIGGFLNLIYMAYFAFFVLNISVTYIETIKSWVFPDFPNWLLMLLLITLIAYGLTGGIRIIVGVCLFGFVFTYGISLFFYAAMQHAQWSFLLPVMEASPSKLLQGTREMALTLSGFEVIFFLYPFLKDPWKANLYAQLGILATNLLYLFVMVVSIVYYSQNQMPMTIWGTLSLLKIIRFPFLERFEYIIIPIWMLILICNMMLFTWVILRGMKRIFGLNQKRTLAIFLLILLISSFLFTTRGQVNKMNDVMNAVTTYLSLIYPAILFLVVKIVHVMRKKSTVQ